MFVPSLIGIMHFFKAVGGLSVQDARTVKRSPTYTVDHAGITLLHQGVTVNVISIEQFNVYGFCNGIGGSLGGFKQAFVKPFADFLTDFKGIAGTVIQDLSLKFGFDVVENNGRHQNQSDSNSRNDKQ